MFCHVSNIINGIMPSIGRLNHVAVAVKNCDRAAKLWRALGLEVNKVDRLPEHGVKVAFVELENSKVELLEPIGKNSPINGFLDRSPVGGIHHICVEVDNVREMMKKVQTHGIRVLSDEPKIGAHGKPVVFLHPKDCNGVLLELEER